MYQPRIPATREDVSRAVYDPSKKKVRTEPHIWRIPHIDAVELTELVARERGMEPLSPVYQVGLTPYAGKVWHKDVMVGWALEDPYFPCPISGYSWGLALHNSHTHKYGTSIYGGVVWENVGIPLSWHPVTAFRMENSHENHLEAFRRAFIRLVPCKDEYPARIQEAKARRDKKNYGTYLQHASAKRWVRPTRIARISQEIARISRASLWDLLVVYARVAREGPTHEQMHSILSFCQLLDI